MTNGIDRVQRARLAASGLAPLFETVVTSQGCGFAKPDPRILHVALDAMGVRPRHAVYVGDDPATDGAAARAAGVRFVWMDRGDEVRGRRPRAPGDEPARAGGLLSRPTASHAGGLDEVHPREGLAQVGVALGLSRPWSGPVPRGRALAVAGVQRVHDREALDHAAEGGEPLPVEALGCPGS